MSAVWLACAAPAQLGSCAALPKAMPQLPLLNTHQHAAPPACCHTTLAAQHRPRTAHLCRRLLSLKELPLARRRRQIGAQRTHLQRMQARAAAQQTEPADSTPQDLLIVGTPSRSSACLLTSRWHGAQLGCDSDRPGRARELPGYCVAGAAPQCGCCGPDQHHDQP